MSTVLGMDTATAELAVAVTEDGELRGESQLAATVGERPRHATELLGEVERLVSGAEGWEAVGRIAVGVGPGSYTGLRIGVATARALAQALGKPLVPVVTLAALSRGLSEPERGTSSARLAVIDARRGQVFAALWAPGGEQLWAPFVAAPEELRGRLQGLTEAHSGGRQTVLAAGDGAVRFRRELEAAGALVLPDDDPVHRLSARHVCALSGSLEPLPLSDVRPIYLRAPDAERWLERDRPKSGS